MSKRPVPGPVMDAWFRPATVDRNIRRDLAKYALSAPPKQQLLEIAAKAAQFSGPVLVVWATEDRMMPRDHGRRLAEAFPDARLSKSTTATPCWPKTSPRSSRRRSKSS